MPKILEIRDGNPKWYLSPDIWVVPGNDPEGAPGSPVAGQSAFIWARIHNREKRTIEDIEVKYYWCNPALGVLRSRANYVGSSFLELEPNQSDQLPCLAPWMPEVVNDGHECLVVEVIHPVDPLPNPLPDRFDPPAYHQIAQRNITVLEAPSYAMVLAIEAAAPEQEDRVIVVRVEIGGEIDPENLELLGIPKYKAFDPSAVIAGLGTTRNCPESPKSLQRELKLAIKKGTAQAVYLTVLAKSLKPGSYVPIDVISNDGNKDDGGITYVVTGKKED